MQKLIAFIDKYNVKIRTNQPPNKFTLEHIMNDDQTDITFSFSGCFEKKAKIMEKIIVVILTLTFLLGCDRADTGQSNERGLTEGSSSEQSGDIQVNRDTLSQGRNTYYTFSGTLAERKSAFRNAASQLEQDVKNLSTRATNDDVREDLEDVREKIAEAREKSAEADEKSANNKTDEAIEKVEEAREKLEEAREKYEKALTDINK